MPLGLAWIAVAGVAMLTLRLAPGAGLANTLFLGLVVAATDVGAYALGRTLGGPRLAPTVSPNKTWAGAVGGLLSGMAVGGVAGYALQPAEPGLPEAAVLAAGLLAVLAIAGDLFESWMKRRCDVKDTSGLLPGHGGLLDRLDGLLAAAPVAALLSLGAVPGAPFWVPG
jgi:phosphatidate cytidylyltransferase